MSLQLIGARESFSTEQPVAHEWTFTGVPAEVGFQVRRFPVNFSTAWDVADVLALSSVLAVVRSKAGGFSEAVGAAALGTATL